MPVVWVRQIQHKLDVDHELVNDFSRGPMANAMQELQRTPSSSTLPETSNTLVAPDTQPTPTTSSGSLLPATSPSLAAWSADPPTRCTTLVPLRMLMAMMTTAMDTTKSTNTPSQRTWLISSSLSTSTYKLGQDVIEWVVYLYSQDHVA